MMHSWPSFVNISRYILIFSYKVVYGWPFVAKFNFLKKSFNFWNIDSIFSVFIQFLKISFKKIDSILEKLIQFLKNWFNSWKIDSIFEKLVQFFKNWFNFSKTDSVFQKLIQFFENWFNFSKLVQFFLNWFNFSKFDSILKRIIQSKKFFFQILNWSRDNQQLFLFLIRGCLFEITHQCRWKKTLKDSLAKIQKPAVFGRNISYLQIHFAFTMNLAKAEGQKLLLSTNGESLYLHPLKHALEV